MGKNITVQAHIKDQLFTTEALVAKITSTTVVLRLMNVEQFDLYSDKAESFSLCYKPGFEANYVSTEIELMYSENNPSFIAVPGDTELIAQNSARSHARYPYTYELIFTYGETTVKCKSIDISSRGMGVSTTRPIPTGTFGMIDVYNPLTKHARSFQARVANCRQMKINDYRVGILFENSEQWILDFINDFQNHVLETVC